MGLVVMADYGGLLHAVQAHLDRVSICIYDKIDGSGIRLREGCQNKQEHGISLQRAEDFDITAAAIEVDKREEYGEVRYNALGFLDAKLYSLTFTMQGDLLRAISLRKATKQERENYAAAF